MFKNRFSNNSNTINISFKAFIQTSILQIKTYKGLNYQDTCIDITLWQVMHFVVASTTL